MIGGFATYVCFVTLWDKQLTLVLKDKSLGFGLESEVISYIIISATSFKFGSTLTTIWVYDLHRQPEKMYLSVTLFRFKCAWQRRGNDFF